MLYISLLNMEFTRHTRVIAFSDDLLVITRGKCALDAEKYAKQDLKKMKTGPGKSKCILMKRSQKFCW
jgi:hypothetical protein